MWNYWSMHVNGLCSIQLFKCCILSYCHTHIASSCTVTPYIREVKLVKLSVQILQHHVRVLVLWNCLLHVRVHIVYAHSHCLGVWGGVESPGYGECVCACLHANACMHVCVHAHTYTCTHTCMAQDMVSVCVHAHSCACTYAFSMGAISLLQACIQPASSLISTTDAISCVSAPPMCEEWQSLISVLIGFGCYYSQEGNAFPPWHMSLT